MDSLNQVRGKLVKYTKEHLRQCIEGDYIQHMVMSFFPGAGKTATIMKTIDEENYTWLYMAPFHEIIVENLRFSQLRNYTFKHLKGRKQPGVCLIDQYRKLAEQGLNIDPFCRTRCHLKQSGCPYYEVRREIESFPQPWAGVHAHIPTYLQSYLFQTKYNKRIMRNYFDVLIIDEFPFQVLYDQVVCNRTDIDRLRDVIHHIERDSDEKEFIQMFLNELSLATGSIKLNYSKLISFLRNHRGLNFQDFITEYDATLLTLVQNKIIYQPPKKILYQLIQIYEENPTKAHLKWNVHKHTWDGWNPTGIYLTTSNIRKFRNLGIPIIALDATARKEAWDELLGADCVYRKVDVQYKNVYQLNTSARYPARSWISRDNNRYILNDTGKKLIELIQCICQRKKYDVLICCNKKVERIIRRYLTKNYSRKNYQFANYYNLRSRNSFYEECDTCIIAHEPNIPPLQTNIISNITGWDTTLLNGLMTTSEVLQAIGRIRQNIRETMYGRKREKIEVFIFPGATWYSGSKLINEARLLSYDRMCDGNLLSIEEEIKRTIKRAGETNAQTLWEVCSDFVTRKTLRSILRKLYLKEYITNYKNSIKWDQDAEEERQKIKYKEHKI